MLMQESNRPLTHKPRLLTNRPSPSFACYNRIALCVQCKHIFDVTFPSNFSDLGNVSIVNSSVNLFSTDQDHSYKCDANATASLEGNGSLSFASVQMQPFNYTTSGFLTGKTGSIVREGDSTHISLSLP